MLNSNEEPRDPCQLNLQFQLRGRPKGEGSWIPFRKKQKKRKKSKAFVEATPKKAKSLSSAMSVAKITKVHLLLRCRTICLALKLVTTFCHSLTQLSVIH